MKDVQTAPALSGDRRTDRFQAAAALGICLVVVLFQALIPEYRKPVADSLHYAKVINDVAGTILSGGDVNRALGTFFGPVYLVFAGLLAAVDSNLLQTLRCIAPDNAVCDLGGLTSLFAAQGVLVAMTVFFTFLAIWRIAGDLRVAWLALVIILAAGNYTNYATLILTETPTFFLLSLFIWLFARVLTDPRPRFRDAFFTGLSLAAAGLTRPSYIYLLYVMVPVIALWWSIGRRESMSRACIAAGVFVLGGAAILVPWAIRNYVTFDLPAVAGGYGTQILVERLAYNHMSWEEWGVSFIYWLPDFGDSLATALFPEAMWIRLGWYQPESFYMMGRGAFFADVRAASGAQDNPLGYLLREYILGDLVKHIGVTLALAARGQWVAKYIGLIGFILLPVCIWLLGRRGRTGVFLMFCLPPYFMLGLYAFVSVNVVRYNEPLIAVFALSIAMVLVHLTERGWLALRRAGSR